jgi:hypothetical protein
VEPRNIWLHLGLASILEFNTGTQYCISVLDFHTGSQYWISDLDLRSGSQYWISVLGLNTGWISVLGFHTGSQHWISVLYLSAELSTLDLNPGSPNWNPILGQLGRPEVRADPTRACPIRHHCARAPARSRGCAAGVGKHDRSPKVFCDFHLGAIPLQYRSIFGQDSALKS